MNTIIHPVTGKIYNISSNEGLHIIGRYMNTYKRGGNASNLDALIKKVDVLTGGAQRLFSDFISSDSGEDDGMLTLKTDVSERDDVLKSLPEELKGDISSEDWNGMASGIHRKDDTGEINLIETDTSFYKFIPEVRFDEINNIYDKLGDISSTQGFPTVFFLPYTYKYDTPVFVDDNTYFVYKFEKWGESLHNIKLKGKLYHSDETYNAPFESVMSWLEEVIRQLHSNNLYHGDIFKSSTEIHWGNILAKQSESGKWEFKLIDFGNEMSDINLEKQFYNELFSNDETYKLFELGVREDEERNIKYKRRKMAIKDSSYETPTKKTRVGDFFTKFTNVARGLFFSDEDDEEEEYSRRPPLPPVEDEGTDILTYSRRPPLPPDDMFNYPSTPTNRTTPEGALRPILTPPPLTPTKKELLRTSPLWNLSKTPSPLAFRRTPPIFDISRTS